MDSPSSGGTGRYAMDLYKLFYPDSSIIQLVYNFQNKDEAYSNHIVPNHLHYPYSAINHLLGKMVFGRHIEKMSGKYSILHIASHRVGPIVARDESDRLVVTIHDLFDFKERRERLGERAFQWMLKRNIRSYSRYRNVIVPSMHVKDDLTNILNKVPENITVIPPFVSDGFVHIDSREKLREELGLPLDKKLILSVSTDIQRKNLKMVALVSEKAGNDFKLVRVGSKVEGSITFSNVSQEKLNKIYNACDLLFFPTLDEGFGYPVIEAFKTGLPVVSSNIEVIREIAGDAGILVDPLSFEECIEGIHKAVGNRDYLVRKGYERAALFSKEKIKEKLLNYYGGICE
ncbi:MAG: glycosyltransferase family 1 protein [Thermoplasmatales archaeon]